MNETQYLANIQTAEDDYRASGLVEWNILQDASGQGRALALPTPCSHLKRINTGNSLIPHINSKY